MRRIFEMAFEKFTKLQVRRYYTPIVSIDKRGIMTFNAAAIQKFELINYKAVEWFLDEERYLLGFRFCTDELPSGSKLILHSKLTAITPLKAIGYALGEHKKYVIYCEGDIHYIVLDQPILSMYAFTAVTSEG